MKEFDLVVIGDLAFDQITTADGKERTNVAGAAYNVAIGASTVSKKVGVVARVGEDFPVEKLTSREIDTEGISVIPKGQTAKFLFSYTPDGGRRFRQERGVASEPHPETLPGSYLAARYIHLPGIPPGHCLIWINSLFSKLFCREQIAVDTFEAFVTEEPELTKAVLEKAGLIFLNEEELRLLRRYGEVPFSVPIILKKGPLGAVYIDGETSIAVPAPQIGAVDTTGAGDILAGVFLALRAQNIPIEKALQEAVNVASCSVTNFGVDHILI